MVDDGLAHVDLAGGDHEGARRHWERALILYTDLEVPRADEIRAEQHRARPVT
jgi:hypothetical protein